MEHKLLGLLSAVLAATAPGSAPVAFACQTGPDYFDYGPHRDDPEAEQLAMTLTGELRAPDAAYERILGDLALVRATYPILTSVVDDPDYVADEMLVKVDSGLPTTDYEALNSYYQVTGVDPIGGGWYVLTFCDSINAPELALIYAELAEVPSAGANGLIGTDDRITIADLGSVWRYTIVDGFLDCFDGCDCKRTWIIDVDETGTVDLVSYTEQGAPYCVFDDAPCCLSSGACGASNPGFCLDHDGVPLDFNAACEGDGDADGTDGSCGDACPDDPAKIDPGVCGCGVAETDGDVDGAPDCVDCAPAAPATYPGAPEINDGLDNQCHGDPGFGVVDEISGISGFLDPGSKDTYSWPGQQGATLYEVARSSVRDLALDCITRETDGTSWLDPEQPIPAEVFHYLVRALAPHTGSWGQDSAGAERSGVCP